MLAVGVVPALVLFFGMLFLPYSPRLMASKGERKKALKILKKIRGEHANVEKELDQIEKSLEQQKGTWKMLFSSHIRITLLIGMGLAHYSTGDGDQYNHLLRSYHFPDGRISRCNDSHIGHDGNRGSFCYFYDSRTSP